MQKNSLFLDFQHRSHTTCPEQRSESGKFKKSRTPVQSNEVDREKKEFTTGASSRSNWSQLLVNAETLTRKNILDFIRLR